MPICGGDDGDENEMGIESWAFARCVVFCCTSKGIHDMDVFHVLERKSSIVCVCNLSQTTFLHLVDGH